MALSDESSFDSESLLSNLLSALVTVLLHSALHSFFLQVFKYFLHPLRYRKRSDCVLVRGTGVGVLMRFVEMRPLFDKGRSLFDVIYFDFLFFLNSLFFHRF